MYLTYFIVLSKIGAALREHVASDRGQCAARLEASFTIMAEVLKLRRRGENSLTLRKSAAQVPPTILLGSYR